MTSWRPAPVVSGALVAPGARVAVGLAHREVVDAADARADTGDVGAVDVHGDRDPVADVPHQVNVAGRREAAHRAGRVGVAGDDLEVVTAHRVDLLVLGALQHGGAAPGQVVVHRGCLAGQPDHDHDRE